MSRASRQFMLATIRRACTQRRGETGVRAAAARLGRHEAGPVPARGRLDREGQIALFTAEATRVEATVKRVASLKDVPGAVAAYLAGQNIEARLKMAPDPWLRNIPWSKSSVISVTEGVGERNDAVGVTTAAVMVAETGTLVLASGPESPTSLALVPPVHVAVVPVGRMVGSYEEAWARLRERAPAGGPFMPRAVNWITGPSRTADIEQTLLLGAHGPQRQLIILVDEEKA
ncbi:MAG: lactate utilization protein C [Alphaproteobacteria bacterium]|nr:lactate utilization protein C [Alphaproteobacteria bacterium]